MRFQQFTKEQKCPRVSFLLKSFLSASYCFSDHSRHHPAPLPAGSGEHRESPTSSHTVAENLCFPLFPAQFYLTVNAEHEQHGEEENCPQRGDGQLCHCFWVCQKRQSRAWGDKQDTKHQWGGSGLGFSAPAVVWGWCGRLWMQHPGRDFSCSVFADHGGTARTWFLK